MSAELKHRWLMVIVLSLAIMFGPMLADAITARNATSNDVQWLKKWIQTANNLDDNARPKR